jgi:hypothetical protein
VWTSVFGHESLQATTNALCRECDSYVQSSRGLHRKVPNGRNLDRVSLPRLGRGNSMVCAFVDGTLVFRVLGCGEVGWRMDLKKHGGRLPVVERRSQTADW